MNALDKLIGYFSPERAYRRARFRAATETFAYDGAKSGRRTDGWVAAGGDANSEIGASLISLRNRSRDLLRNNPYASKAIAELVGNTVGTGIVPQAKTGTPDLDKIIDNEWQYFAENCDPGGQLDFYGMQALIVRTTAESGDGIVRFRQRLPQDNFRVPLQLQVLEGDFLDISRTMGVATGNVVQGVQFNLYGQREYYWLYNYHPGSVYMLSPRGGILSQPVPAAQVMHTYCILRPGQVRGVPWLAPVMLALRDLDDYRDAERMTPSANAVYVIELNGDRILYWGSASSSTFTYSISGNAWDTTTFAARSAAHAAGSFACPSFFIRPDAAKQARHSYIFVFRGGAGLTMDVFDIAGTATGAWTVNQPYGGSGMTFTTGTCMTPDPYTGGGRFAFINPNGLQRCLKFDVKNRVLSPAFFLRYPMSTAAVGGRMSTAMFVDGATKLVFIILQRMGGAEVFEMAVQK